MLADGIKFRNYFRARALGQSDPQKPCPTNLPILLKHYRINGMTQEFVGTHLREYVKVFTSAR